MDIRIYSIKSTELRRLAESPDVGLAGKDGGVGPTICAPADDINELPYEATYVI